MDTCVECHSHQVEGGYDQALSIRALKGTRNRLTFAEFSPTHAATLLDFVVCSHVSACYSCKPKQNKFVRDGPHFDSTGTDTNQTQRLHVVQFVSGL